MDNIERQQRITDAIMLNARQALLGKPVNPRAIADALDACDREAWRPITEPPGEGERLFWCDYPNGEEPITEVAYIHADGEGIPTFATHWRYPLTGPKGEA